MTFWQRIKKCTIELKVLFSKSIGPLASFLFLYYLVSRFIIFPIGRKIWSSTLATLPDGYLDFENLGQLVSHPWVILIAFILGLLYCVITFMQIECAFVFLMYRYNDKVIGFKDLIVDVIKRTIKVIYPRNWPMILLVVLAIPFANIFIVTSDISSISVPEFILTAIFQKPGYLVAYLIFELVVIYIVIKGLYVEITFVDAGNSFRKAFKDSAKLTKGFVNKLRKLLGLLLTRAVSIILFSAVPALLVGIIYFFSNRIFGKSPTFNAAMQLVQNGIAFPVILAFATAMSCAVSISLIVIWFHVDSENDKEIRPDMEIHNSSGIVAKIISAFTAKVLLIIIGICVAAYCIMIPVSVNLLKYNPEFVLNFSLPVKIIAHKGYSEKAPENTIPALEKAIECGNASMVEFDVQATKDGVPVVMHDRNAGALTGVYENICDMKLEQVKELRLAYSKKKGKTKYAEVPTLEEYLKACDHRIDLLLEIKNYNSDPKLESRVMKLLKKYNYLDGSCQIQSGSISSLKKVKEINQNIECGLIMTFAIGTYYDLPYADFYSIESSFVTSDAVFNIQSRDKWVYSWTVDGKYTVIEMVDANTDGIICDNPNKISRFINDYVGNVVLYSSNRMREIADIVDYGFDDLLNQDKKKQVNTEYGD